MKGTSRYSLLLVIFLFYMPFVLFTVYQDNPQIHNFHPKLFYLSIVSSFSVLLRYVVIYFWYRQKEKGSIRTNLDSVSSLLIIGTIIVVLTLLGTTSLEYILLSLN